MTLSRCFYSDRERTYDRHSSSDECSDSGEDYDSEEEHLSNQENDLEECTYCTKSFKKSGINRHLASCKKRKSSILAGKIRNPIPKRNYSYEERMIVWSRFNVDEEFVSCPFCRCRMYRDDTSTWHMSHVLARSRGGTNDLKNIRPICEKCNIKMGDAHMVVYSYMIDKPHVTKRFRI